MGSFKEKPDGLSQLEALVDLLIDLHVTKPNNSYSESSSSSNQEQLKKNSEKLSDLSVEKAQRLQKKSSSAYENSSNLLNHKSQEEEQPKENVIQSNFSDENLAQIENVSALQSLQDIIISSAPPVETVESDINNREIAEVDLEQLESRVPSVEAEAEKQSSFSSGIKQENLESRGSFVEVEAKDKSALSLEIKKEYTEELKNKTFQVEEGCQEIEKLEKTADTEEKLPIKFREIERELESSSRKKVSYLVDLEKKEDLDASEKIENKSPLKFQNQEQTIEKQSNKHSQDQSDLQQIENLAIAAELVSNSLIKNQQSENKSYESIGESSVEIDDPQIEEERKLLSRLQTLLLPAEVLGSREIIVNIKEKVTNLEHHIYEPAELTNLLVPLITEILSIKVSEAREEVVKAIAPVVDGMIEAKTQQDKVAITSALAPVIADAVAERVNSFPGELAEALAPEIAIAIKQQIALERDAMVDALYPVIGSIIAKYMSEVLKAINEKVENAFSVEGFLRKFRAQMQGVSEAELMLKEATPFTVKAIFLIHKASGLVIAEAQSKNNQHLESEMVAGMLTAIRSFVNDCIAQTGDVSEIDQINYGGSKIILEVAGYCYLAVVIQGSTPRLFMRQMREALGKIVQSHGRAIELFDGDPENVPGQVPHLMEKLTRFGNNKLSVATDNEHKRPVALLAITAAVMSLILIPWGIFQLRAESNSRLESDISLALASEPELAVYNLKVAADGNNLKLAGKLPNQYLRAKAEEIVKKVQPKIKINNAIIAVKAPADQSLAAAEVKRLTSIFNKIDGVEISSSYDAGKVTLEGIVLQLSDTKKITAAFEQIPGVEFVYNTVQLQTEALTSRIYFERASSQLKPAELAKILQIKEFFKQFPNKGIKIVGHSDSSGTNKENQRLAIERAKAVRDILVNQGIDTRRLQVDGTTNLPRGVDADQPLWLSRCVEFEIITP